MLKKITRKLKGDGKGSQSIPSASTPSSIHDQESTTVDPRVTEARLKFEREIKKDGLQKPGESMGDVVDRLKREFVDQWKDYEPKVNIREPHDRVTKLIFSGQSDKPKTDASSPSATANDRNQALVESALENFLRPKQPPTHQIIPLDPTDLD